MSGLWRMHMLAAGGTEIERRLMLILIQIGLIILIARAFATLFRRMGQPAVVGEIVAGLVLGPSVLGKLESWGWVPQISERIFDPSVAPVMGVLSQIGLVLLLFLIGLEFDFSHLRSRGRAAASISITGIAAPFALGALLGYIMHPHLEQRVNHFGFVLFLGTAMSITALPILGRMMMEMKISRTRVGALTITAAAIDDAAGWILLAAVSALAQAQFHLMDSVGMIGQTLLFLVAMLMVVRPLMRQWIGWMMRRHDGELGLNGLAVVLAALFGCAVITSWIGIFAIFGAFLLGAILSDQHALRAAVQRSLSAFVTVFFLPIFFTYTGLRTDIGTLNTGLMWVFAGAVFAVAVGAKLGGCTLAARMSGLPLRESACIGVMMNTRALMELVVINVGFDLGVIPKSVFCMLVMMAVLTTVMTTPLLVRTMRGTELEEGIVSAGFARRKAMLRDADEAVSLPA